MMYNECQEWKSSDHIGATPRHPNSFDFMQFPGEFGKIVGWRPMNSGCPHLGEILIPPLDHQRH